MKTIQYYAIIGMLEERNWGYEELYTFLQKGVDQRYIDLNLEETLTYLIRSRKVEMRREGEKMVLSLI